MEIKPHPYKFRQDIEIEVIHAQRSYKRRDYDQYDKSIEKLKKFLCPMLEKWTKVKEFEQTSGSSFDDDSIPAQEFGRTFYYTSWIQYIESKEGYKGLSIDDWNKLIDFVFKERILAYKKHGKKSSFLGYLHRWFYFYILTAYRKIKAENMPAKIFFNNDDLQEVFMRTVKKLPKIQKNTFEDYYFNNLDYKNISKKYNVSESTARKNKEKAIKNIKKMEYPIYIELKRKFKGSKGKYLK